MNVISDIATWLVPNLFSSRPAESRPVQTKSHIAADQDTELQKRLADLKQMQAAVLTTYDSQLALQRQHPELKLLTNLPGASSSTADNFIDIPLSKKSERPAIVEDKLTVMKDQQAATYAQVKTTCDDAHEAMLTICAFCGR